MEITDNKIEIIPTSKVCGRCKKEKLLIDFRKSKTGKYGVHGFCKKCHSLDSHEKYQKNKDLRLAQIDFWQSANPHKLNRYVEKWRKKKIKEMRQLKRGLKNLPPLLNENPNERIEDGKISNF